ncbi:hypothetical protein [Rhizobium sp. FY34]|uniref:hypothetical protein n=1 Tax=Rhizobium sp. FY34 TaxID=2562309 RepID=UPI001981FC15|nr:hypothetical protein [Rhizobium sp. FY34]
MRASSLSSIEISESQGGFPVEQGQSITAWAMSPVSAVLYPGQSALAEDRVNYRFINGFVDVGDLPCRVALWNEIKTRQVTLQADFAVEGLYLPGFNRRVEFSGFWHRPTRLSRWLKTRLVPERAGAFRFRLTTCGGVRIWVDGVEQAVFEPFRRNRESTTEITLQLKAGGSDVVVLTEELAERDALWYFELSLLDDQPLRIELPVDVSDATLAILKDLAIAVRPTPLHVRDGRLTLAVERPVDVDVSVSAKILPSVHMRDKPPLLDVTGLLKAGETSVSLSGAEHLPDGFHALNLTFSIGETRLARHIGFATLSEPLRDLSGLSLAQRKAEAIAFAAQNGEQRAGKAIAMMAAGLPVDTVFREIIANTLGAINERRDCSDFVLVPLLWLYAQYKDRLPDDMQSEIREAILSYRYWVDEPGNDVMWFWSENHVLCFHVSQYLAGRLLPRAGFTCSGRIGEEQARLGEERLLKWFDSVEHHGLAEWNSAAYYPVDFIGLLALEQLGEGVIQTRARALVDRLFLMIGLHTLAGVPAGTMGRAYDKELRAGPLTELAPFATVAFGEGWLNDGVASLTMLAAGSYVPPAKAAAVVKPEPGKALTAHYVQGHDEAARLVLYKTAAVQLSSMMDGKPGGRGHQQHVIDLRLAADPFARAWVNHPGEDDPWGSQRPSYWAGNGSMPRAAQYENTGLMLYDLGDNPRIGFTHAYVETSAFDTVERFGKWIVMRAGRGFAALGATQPIDPVTTGPGAGIEFRAHGARCGWAAIMAEGDGDAAFAAFCQSLSETQLTIGTNGRLQFVSREGRSLSLDWDLGLFLNDTPYSFPNRSLEPAIRHLDAVCF